MDLSDPTTFHRTYDEHASAMLAVAMRVVRDPVVAQDVVQDVFERVWRHPHKFDQRRGELGSYLRLMARSRAVDVWREQQAAGRATDRIKFAAGFKDGRIEDRPAEATERESEGRRVRAALGRLPEPQREAVVLSYWGGLTADEVARRVGVPLGTAKSRIRLAMAKLREEFASDPAAPAAA